MRKDYNCSYFHSISVPSETLTMLLKNKADERKKFCCLWGFWLVPVKKNFLSTFFLQAVIWYKIKALIFKNDDLLFCCVYKSVPLRLFEFLFLKIFSFLYSKTLYLWIYDQDLIIFCKIYCDSFLGWFR